MTVKKVLTLLFVVIVVIAAIAPIYFVRSGAGGMVYSKPDVAYLFVGSGHLGWRS